MKGLATLDQLGHDGHVLLGVDPSMACTGVALPDGTTTTWSANSGTKATPLARLDIAFVWAQNLVHDHGGTDQTIVLVEGYAYGRANQAHQLGEFGGALRLGWRYADAFVVEVPPTVVKRLATGKGNANKDLVRDAARDRFGLPAGVTSDECDARWVLEAGRQLVGHPDALDLPKAHRAAFDKWHAFVQ